MDIQILITGILAFLFAAIIPGYFISLAVYPAKKDFNELERLAFSIVFAITSVPLAMFVENTALKIPLNRETIAVTIAVLIAGSLLIYFARTGRIKIPKDAAKIIGAIPEKEAAGINPFGKKGNSHNP